MPLSISKGSLTSKVIRATIGDRLIDVTQTSIKEKDEKGNILGTVLDIAGKFVGFIFRSAFSIIRFTISGLVGALFNTVNFLMNFNWNVSDEALDNQVKQQWSALGGVLGGFTGNIFGWISCGVLPGAAVMAFNEPMGAYILKEVGEEFIEEVAGNLSAVVQFSFRAASQSLFAWSFKNVRKWLKQDDNIFAQYIFGENYANVKANWGKNNGPSITAAGKRDERVEQIKNEFWRNFVTEFIEEGWDACVEAGYVVAQSTESYLASQRLTNQTVFGSTKYVEVTPNRETPKERVILTGPSELLKHQIVNTLATHSLIANRDVGQIIGYDEAEKVRAQPQLRRIVIKCFNQPEPPWKRGSQRYQPVTIKIPDVPRANLDWEKIRNACGGSQGYGWGRFIATAALDNGRQIQCYGSSQNEAEKRLMALAKLTTAKITVVNFSEETKLGVRAEKTQLQKESCTVYPGYVTVFVYKPDPSGRVNQQGQVMKEHSVRLDLWGTSEPANWKDELEELFRGNTE